MPLTKETMHLYYDLTPIKDSDGIVVMVGKKKSTDEDETHPPRILFKQGLGAMADSHASQLLQTTGLPGFLPVIHSGDDYFIRAAYDKPSSKWAAVEGQAARIMEDALDLSLAMLSAGVIDKDRKFMKGSGDIDARNAVIANGRLVFFDFEPERIIDWKKPLTHADADSIATWKLTYETLIKSLAANLHLNQKSTQALLERFYGTAEKILADKGPAAAKIWQQLTAPEEADLGGSYKPPSMDSAAVYTPPDGGSRPSSDPKVIPAKPITASAYAPTRMPVPTVTDIFVVLSKHLTSPTLPDEAIVDRMARMAHRYANHKSQSEPNVYDALEKLIKAQVPPKTQEKAIGMVAGVKKFLDDAYKTQLHDPDELGARPRGPWGRSG